MELSPIASIAWLTGCLTRFGRKIKAGNAVMTGSFTTQHQFEGPIEVEIHFEPFGTVTVCFTRGDP